MKAVYVKYQVDPSSAPEPPLMGKIAAPKERD